MTIDRAVSRQASAVSEARVFVPCLLVFHGGGRKCVPVVFFSKHNAAYQDSRPVVSHRGWLAPGRMGAEERSRAPRRPSLSCYPQSLTPAVRAGFEQGLEQGAVLSRGSDSS